MTEEILKDAGQLQVRRNGCGGPLQKGGWEDESDAKSLLSEVLQNRPRDGRIKFSSTDTVYSQLASSPCQKPRSQGQNEPKAEGRRKTTED